MLAKKLKTALPLALTKNGEILAAAIVGSMIFLFVGFAPMHVVHNAAHDIRHAAAFPCH